MTPISSLVRGPILAASLHREFKVPQQQQIADLASMPSLEASLSALLETKKGEYNPGDRGFREVTALQRAIARNPSDVKVLHDGEVVLAAATASSFDGVMRVDALVIRDTDDMDRSRALMLHAMWEARGNDRLMIYTDSALGSAAYDAMGAVAAQGDAFGDLVYLWGRAPIIPRR